MAAAWELARYKLYLMGVQNVRGNKEDKVRQADFIFGNHRIVSAVTRIWFVITMVSYILVVLGCRWCNIIVLQMHAPIEDKSDYLKDSFTRNFRRFFIIVLSVI
jgi:hypothetical protein